jgi:hypothetical protein
MLNRILKNTFGFVSIVTVGVLAFGVYLYATYSNNKYYLYSKNSIYNSSQTMLLQAWVKYGLIFSQQTGVDRESDELMRKAQKTVEPLYKFKNPITNVSEFNAAFISQGGYDRPMSLIPLPAVKWKCIIRGDDCVVPMNFDWGESNIPPIRIGAFRIDNQFYDGDIIEFSGLVKKFFYREKWQKTWYASSYNRQNPNTIHIEISPSGGAPKIIGKQLAVWDSLQGLFGFDREFVRTK